MHTTVPRSVHDFGRCAARRSNFGVPSGFLESPRAGAEAGEADEAKKFWFFRGGSNSSRGISACTLQSLARLTVSAGVRPGSRILAFRVASWKAHGQGQRRGRQMKQKKFLSLRRGSNSSRGISACTLQSPARFTVLAGVRPGSRILVFRVASWKAHGRRQRRGRQMRPKKFWSLRRGSNSRPRNIGTHTSVPRSVVACAVFYLRCFLLVYS
jgi:hypothetical protein